VLSHYSDELTGMGDYLLDKCRVAFFEVYSGIVRQIRDTTNKDILEFLLNCIKWRISATDHQFVVKSGIIQTLKDGNGLHSRDKNPIKYSWGHRLDFKSYDGDSTLSHLVIDSLEFIMMACFARVLGEDDDKSLSVDKGGTSIGKIQQAYSVVNTNITEVLLASTFEIVFEQLTRYAKIVESFDPIDWKLFVKRRNQMRVSRQDLAIDDSLPFEDEKTEEEKLKEAEEDKKQAEEDLKQQDAPEDGSSRDRVVEAIERQTDKEFKKLNSMYDEKVILKLLRMLELFTAIAVKSSHIHQFVLQVTRPTQIKALVHLLLNCQSRHGMITLKILTNLLRIGIDTSTLDSSFVELKEAGIGSDIFDIQTKVQFDGCPFLQFCYSFLYKIRSSQWDKRRIESYGAYNISCNVVRLLRTILRTNCRPAWKAKIEQVMDAFIADIDSYPIEEFDILLSLFEGGEYNGLNTGAFGKTAENNKFITVGFVKDWYDLSTPDGQGSSGGFEIKDIKSDLTGKDDYLLAIYYDDEHPQRNDMFLAIPDQVSLISSLSSDSDNYLLDKTRLNNFVTAMQLDSDPDKNSVVSLTKRCVGMKILVEQIERHGEKLSELLDESFRNRFISYLLKECTRSDDKKDSLKCDWYDQKLYAIKKLVTESQTSLKSSVENSVIFGGKMMSVLTTVGDAHESYYECFSLASALNYG